MLPSPLHSLSTLRPSNSLLHDTQSPQGGLHGPPHHPLPTLPPSLPALLTVRPAARILTVPHTHSTPPSDLLTLFLPSVILQVLPIHQGPLQMPLPPTSCPPALSNRTLCPFLSEACTPSHDSCHFFLHKGSLGSEPPGVSDALLSLSHLHPFSCRVSWVSPAVANSSPR